MTRFRKGDFDNVGDENFIAEIGDVHAAALGQGDGMGRNDEGQLVAENSDGGELLLLRNEGDHAEIEPVIEELGGDVAREGASDREADVGAEAAVTHQGGQECVDGAFVDAKGELAAAASARRSSRARLVSWAQVQHALGVVDQELAGCR